MTPAQKVQATCSITDALFPHKPGSDLNAIQRENCFSLVEEILAPLVTENDSPEQSKEQDGE